jgi:hypothetical protein
LDIIAGFASLIVVSFFSLRRLKRLDASSSIEIVNVLYDPWNVGNFGLHEADRGTRRQGDAGIGNDILEFGIER